jgi:hypothetical protein
MCFSPQADLVGGVAIGATGLDTLRHSHHRRTLALAALPLLLAGHQFVESFVWWSLEGKVPTGLGHVAMWVYLTFAFCVLPVYVPAAVMGIELGRARRRLMAVFVVIGAAVSVLLLVAMVRGPVFASLGLYHVQYHISVPFGGVVVGLYVAATCGAMLFSGERHVVGFGAVNLAAAVVIALLITSGFASVWCAWAAVTSGAIAVHLRYSPVHRAARPEPA